MVDRLLGAVGLLLACAMAWAAQSYTAEFSYEPVGPRAFPQLLAGFLALISAWLLFSPSRRAEPAPARDPGLPRALAVTAAAMLAYALLFQTLGFPLATMLMAVPVGRTFGGKTLPLLATGLGLGLGMYVLFDKLFDVILPTGLLAFVLGGR